MNRTGHLIDLFGGGRAMARAINKHAADVHPGGRLLTEATVNMWRSRGRTPSDWFPAILMATEELNLGVTAKDLVNLAILDSGNPDTPSFKTGASEQDTAA